MPWLDGLSTMKQFLGIYFIDMMMFHFIEKYNHKKTKETIQGEIKMTKTNQNHPFQHTMVNIKVIKAITATTATRAKQTINKSTITNYSKKKNKVLLFTNKKIALYLMAAH